MLPPRRVRALAVRLLLAQVDRQPGRQPHPATPRAQDLRSTVLVLAISTDLGISVVSASIPASTMISTISYFGPSSGVAVSVSAASVSAILISDSARRCGGDPAGLGGMAGQVILTGFRMAIACPMTWA
jgi:hypothetical protein